VALHLFVDKPGVN